MKTILIDKSVTRRQFLASTILTSAGATLLGLQPVPLSAAEPDGATVSGEASSNSNQGGSVLVDGSESGNFNFAEASGTVQGSQDRFHVFPEVKEALSWDRLDIAWDDYEPQRGEYRQEYLEKFGRLAVAYAAAGRHFLPMLGYTAPWAGEGDGTFFYKDRKFVRQSQPNGRVRVQTWVKGKEGAWVLRGEEDLENPKVPIAESRRADWEDYVRRCVSYLQAAPYNLKFFQIWNEAYPTSGFWYGDLDAYMQRVHLPAASIIHELGGKVVYGGWPCGGNLRDYIALLDKHKAWDSVDVLDVHYFPVTAYNYLRKECLKRGFEKFIWQTEVGFSSDPNFVGNTYPRFVEWCLRNDPGKNKYKMFYFAMGSPDDPKAYGYGRSLLTGNRLSVHGASLLALGKLLNGNSLKLYENISSEPPLKPELNENLSSIETFIVDQRRIVAAIHFVPGNEANIFIDIEGNSIHLDFGDPHVTLQFPAVQKGNVAKVERWSMRGSVKDISQDVAIGPDGKGISLSVQIRDENLKDGEYVDMPENHVHKTFYVALELKS